MVITGLPCPAASWEKLLGKKRGQRIITIREVFDNSATSDPREMSLYITRELERERPASIVCHDIGVPLALMALLRLRGRGITWKTKVTLFNGAFRQVSLLKANHPLRVQLMTEKRMIAEVKKHGGDVDLELKKFLPRIRAMYRYVILYRLSEKLTSFLGLDDFAGFPGKAGFPAPVQIIASPNDPFLPIDSVEQLRRDLRSREFTEVEYGHFPYSASPEQIVPLLEAFEKSASA